MDGLAGREPRPVDGAPQLAERRLVGDALQARQVAGQVGQFLGEPVVQVTGDPLPLFRHADRDQRLPVRQDLAHRADQENHVEAEHEAVAQRKLRRVDRRVDGVVDVGGGGEDRGDRQPAGKLVAELLGAPQVPGRRRDGEHRRGDLQRGEPGVNVQARADGVRNRDRQDQDADDGGRREAFRPPGAQQAGPRDERGDGEQQAANHAADHRGPYRSSGGNRAHEHRQHYEEHIRSRDNGQGSYQHELIAARITPEPAENQETRQQDNERGRGLERHLLGRLPVDKADMRNQCDNDCCHT